MEPPTTPRPMGSARFDCDELEEADVGVCSDVLDAVLAVLEDECDGGGTGESSVVRNTLCERVTSASVRGLEDGRTGSC